MFPPLVYSTHFFLKVFLFKYAFDSLCTFPLKRASLMIVYSFTCLGFP
nr:MAG TPA: hypothetical protein [Caudoviricetes sp.]